MDPKEPRRVVKVGKCLSSELAEKLMDLLQKNQDVFTWTHADVVGIHPDVMCHRLNIHPKVKPVHQKRRVLDTDRYKALQDEVVCLLKIGFMRESYYPNWLSNSMLILKSNGKWRTCIDFTNSNKAYPKDGFLLPRIDRLVDATTGHELLSFMDIYSRYN